MKQKFALFLIAVALVLLVFPPQVQSASDYIMVLEADGTVVPAMENYIDRGLRQAEDDSAELVIIRLDTPGGAVNIMENIIQLIRGSDVPVVVYVAPRGAIAGSAGALITLAGHQSAMSPETVIGAASPIGPDGTDLTETINRKAQNILTATARTLTADRSPEAQELAQRMITDAEAVSAQEALDAGLIDYIATHNQDLISQLDSKEVRVGEREITLDLLGLEIRTVEMNFVEQVLMVLTDPTLVFSLLSVGILLIIIELSHPGGFMAGVVGGASIILSLYGLGVLPINWLGLILILAALIMFAIEIQMPGTQGLLTIAAAFALGFGGYIMFNTPEIDQYGSIPLVVIIGESIAFGAVGLGVLYLAMETRYSKPVTGEEGMIGLIGEVRTALEPSGRVFVQGELWKAETVNGAYVNKGEKVMVAEVQDLLLRVLPADEDARLKGPPGKR